MTISTLGGPPSICFSDLAVDSNSSPSVIKVHLRRSKTDPFGQGIAIFISRTDTILCPVTALLGYLAAWPPSTSMESPLFIWQDGSPLSRDQFVQRIRTALNSVGINSANYAGHSFRIGAATTAAQACRHTGSSHQNPWSMGVGVIPTLYQDTSRNAGQSVTVPFLTLPCPFTIMLIVQ